MYANSGEHHVHQHESELLIARLLRVAKALIMVEDRRADLLMQDAAGASTDRLVGITDEAADCRAVADAASDLVLRIGGFHAAAEAQRVTT